MLLVAREPAREFQPRLERALGLRYGPILAKAQMFPASSHSLPLELVSAGVFVALRLGRGGRPELGRRLAIRLVFLVGLGRLGLGITLVVLGLEHGLRLGHGL